MQGGPAVASRDRAPGRLELVREFVNSNDIDEGVDSLAAPDQLAAWLEANGLGGEGRDAASLDDDAVRRTAALREALRALLLANNGEPPDSDAGRTLNRIAADAGLVVRFDGGGAELAPTGGGIDAAHAEILAIVYSAIADGTWPRLKACREDTCQWAFYDNSRNRSGAWCSMAVCGNRTKARKYRQRRKSANA
jgi:predicted RNA-binding Zn ribbon-like protein